MDKFVGLRELRENTEKYVKKVAEGNTFIIYRHLKPVFKISPPVDEKWEEVVDLTKIKKGGVEINELLKRL